MTSKPTVKILKRSCIRFFVFQICKCAYDQNSSYWCWTALYSVPCFCGTLSIIPAQVLITNHLPRWGHLRATLNDFKFLLQYHANSFSVFSFFFVLLSELIEIVCSFYKKLTTLLMQESFRYFDSFCFSIFWKNRFQTASIHHLSIFRVKFMLKNIFSWKTHTILFKQC